jgi:hypothetical protein
MIPVSSARPHPELARKSTGAMPARVFVCVASSNMRAAGAELAGLPSRSPAGHFALLFPRSRAMFGTRASHSRAKARHRTFQHARVAHLRCVICPICQAKIRFLRKIFIFRFSEYYVYLRPVPPPYEGRTRRHERWKRDAMDASVSRDERHGCLRRRRVVLAPLGWC